MVKKMSGVIAVLAASAVMASAQSLTVYVSPAGSDEGGNGSADSPFATLAKAAEAVQGAASATVYVRGGVYRMTAPLTLKGQNNVTYAAYGDERPVFAGSTPLTGWKKVRDSKILRKVGKDVRGSLYCVNLAKLGITDLGGAYSERNRPELFYNGDLQQLSRWPNEGFVVAGKALGETVIPPVANGNSGAVEPIVEYLDERIDRWAEEKDPKADGYWFYDWNDERKDIVKVDAEANSLTFSRGRMFRHGARFYGINLLCELDIPGEWYLDRETSILYWCPPQGVNPVRDAAGVTLSTLKGKDMLVLDGCKGVTLRGLTFTETRSGGVRIVGGDRCAVRDCRLTNIGTTAITVKDGYGHVIDGNLIEHIAGGGVKIDGGDRANLIHADFEISNNMFCDFARYNRTYAQGIQSNVCGMHVHHNEFRHSPSSAFSLGGNDIVLEFNLIDSVAEESDDQGAFDLYLNPSMRGIILRYNRWRNVVGGTRYGVGGVRLDDLITGVQIYGNLFENCGSVEFGAVQIHGGSENSIEDNVFYGCKYAVSFTQYGKELWQETYERIYDQMYGKVNIESPEYLLRYPEIREFGKNIDVNIIRNNLIVDCGEKYFHDNGEQIESNNVEIKSDGKPAESFCTASYLHPLGIKRVPVEEMHINRNIWIQNQ